MGASLNITDLILLLIFVPAIIVGIRKGFVRQLAGLIALVLGVWAGYHFTSFLSGKLNIWLDSISSIVNIISFSLIFLAVLLCVTLLGHFISGIIKVALLGWLDKILGVIFAIIKTAFILSIVIYILKSFDSIWNFLPKKSLADSDIYLFLERLASKVFPYLKDLQDITLNV